MPHPKEFVVDTPDVSLAVLHWPGQGNPILLLHATGFHARCWTQVVKQLPGRDIYAVDLRYHGRSGKTGTPNWLEMAADIEQLIDTLDLPDLIAVGHSIGGYLTVTAAARQPGRFRHLVLIDPVIHSPAHYRNRGASPIGMSLEDSPIAKRKNAWRDAQEMFDRFEHRHPFSTWHPDVLWDYCEYGLGSPDEDGLRPLACEPLDEAGIYFNSAGNEVILEHLPAIETPVTLLRAPPGNSDRMDFSFSPTDPDLAKRLGQCEEFYYASLNHFIPMQRPDLVAQHILAVP